MTRLMQNMTLQRKMTCNPSRLTVVALFSFHIRHVTTPTNSLTALPPSFPSISEAWEIPFEEISDLQWVGSGAQGAVFLGKLYGQEVAVKKVRNIKETDIKNLRKLKHPNIITFKLVELIS